MRLDAGGWYATGLAGIGSHVSLKTRQRARTLLPAARPGRTGGPAQTNIFLEMVHHRRAGDIGDSGGVDVSIESFCLLSGALDPPGFVVSMRLILMKFLRFITILAAAFCFNLPLHAELVDAIKAVVNNGVVTYAEVEEFATPAA